MELNVAETSPFTGVLGSGDHTGLIRMGAAGTLETSIAPHGTPMFPGYGIKFFRTGVKSADWVGLRAEGPGGSWDYFDRYVAVHTWGCVFTYTQINVRARGETRV